VKDETFKAGDRARIIEMPEAGAHFIGALVTVATHGGLDPAPDDVMARTDSGQMVFVKAHQLARIAKA